MARYHTFQHQSSRGSQRNQDRHFRRDNDKRDDRSRDRPVSGGRHSDRSPSTHSSRDRNRSGIVYNLFPHFEPCLSKWVFCPCFESTTVHLVLHYSSVFLLQSLSFSFFYLSFYHFVLTFCPVQIHMVWFILNLLITDFQTSCWFDIFSFDTLILHFMSCNKFCEAKIQITHTHTVRIHTCVLPTPMLFTSSS